MRRRSIGTAIPSRSFAASILPELARRLIDREGNDMHSSPKGSHLVCGRGERPGSLQRGDGGGGLPGGSIGPMA